jgi:hypothetical protein
MPELVACKHCHESGTCDNGKEKNSCDACAIEYIKGYDPLSSEKVFYGLKCSVCDGLGQDEPTTFKWHNRFLPILTATFVALAVILLLVFGLMESKYFENILVFASTLIGSITGFYYGGERLRSLSGTGLLKKGEVKKSSIAEKPLNEIEAEGKSSESIADPAAKMSNTIDRERDEP